MGEISHSVSGLIGGTTYYFTAKAENSGGTVWASVKSFQAINNLPPDDILPPGTLSMLENLPIGSPLLHFSATDPDPGSILTFFSLSDINSTTQNELFTIDSNGTLRNAANFDYENNASSYLVRIRATDQLNAFREEEFNIQLQNVNEPSPSFLMEEPLIKLSTAWKEPYLWPRYTLLIRILRSTTRYPVAVMIPFFQWMPLLESCDFCKPRILSKD